jgi:hypothetical protein
MAAFVPLALLFALATGVPADAATPVGNKAVSAISHEPLYAGIVTTASRLEQQTDAFAAKPKLNLLGEARFAAYAHEIETLSDADMKGHLDLKARGTDNDLKCIMMGVSLDLPKKLAAIRAAKSDAELGTALGNMSALLNDNIDVIVTPATADSGLDCVIEFGNR